ncbi:MAG: MYXO-CTERM sorting domain-containing protein, partial [Myxococcota bacterium]|nr:MYXO-CTERM sorting domain-containing protein [Myxococcota bacterium]
GLSHDGTKGGVEYYPGHGEGVTQWAPIMGWTASGVNQWSRGHYRGANNKENDLAIITSRNGFDYRVDDHGDTWETATELLLDGGASGIIERPTDVDAFVLTLSRAGNLVVTASPAALSPNLDIEMILTSSTGEVLGSSNPAERLDASLNLDLEAGEYLLTLDGVGFDDPNSDGYPEYGSLGYFSVETRFEAAPDDTSGPGGETGLSQDSGSDSASGAADTGVDSGETPVGGCACSTGRQTVAPLWAVLLLGLGLRRRRRA